MKALLKILTISSFLGLSFLSLANNNDETKQTWIDKATGNLCYTNQDTPVCRMQIGPAQWVFGPAPTATPK